MFIDQLVDADLRDVVRERRAAIDEFHVECSLRGEPAIYDNSWNEGATVLEPVTEQTLLTDIAWSAEPCRDPGLVALVIPFMPTLLERMEFDLRVEAPRRPHPLIVTTAATVEAGVVRRFAKGVETRSSPRI